MTQQSLSKVKLCHSGQPKDAMAHNVEEWADFEVLEIPLDIFVEDWLITLDEDGVLVGVNWNAQLEGKEIEPSELAKMYL
ncbi:Protein of uncharacterised function (DUF2750) [Vibrio vulnificus]|nr:Protein of uncharacterised function (DUF2750) [Vibrio vulnificus]